MFHVEHAKKVLILFKKKLFLNLKKYLPQITGLYFIDLKQMQAPIFILFFLKDTFFKIQVVECFVKRKSEAALDNSNETTWYNPYNFSKEINNISYL